MKLKDSPIDWKVGDKAVCIEGAPWFEFDARGNRCVAKGPELGEVCTVNRVDIMHGAQVLTFDEWPGEYDHFTACSFDKPRENFTGIEALRSLLTPVRETEDA